MTPIKLTSIPAGNKYDSQAIRWIDKGDHYELIFTDNFVTPSSSAGFPGGSFGSFRCGSALLTDIIMDMRDGNKAKEVHVFVGSFGGEVAALNMILQQLLTYEYRVGINLGTACSCGWMLLFACQERYVSPFSQAMYHDISCICGGKHSELKLNAEFMGRWQDELLKITDTTKVLTEKELELGRTSEVWLTGQQLIERGAAKDYNEYLTRSIPQPLLQCCPGGDRLFCKFPDGWHEVDLGVGKRLTYAEVIEAVNQKSDGCIVIKRTPSKKRKSPAKKGNPTTDSKTQEAPAA